MRWMVAAGFAFAPFAAAFAECDRPLEVQAVFPAADSTGVPTNARVWVHTTHGDEDSLQVALFQGTTPVSGSLVVRVGGLLSAGGTQLVTFVPIPSSPSAQALLPNTEYRIVLEGPALALPNGETSWEQVFTTGAGPENDAPVWAGITDLRFAQTPSTTEGCDAGPERWTFHVTGADAIPAAVAYSVDRQGFALANGPTPELVYEGTVEGPGTRVCLKMRAISISGKVDENTTERCFTPESEEPDDTEPEDTNGPDTGRPETGWRDTGWSNWDSGWLRRNGDCSVLTVRLCATSPASIPVFVVPFVMLVLARRRKR